MTNPTNAAQDALNELAQIVGWLASTLLPGTAKPYSAPTMSDEKLAARAMQDRAFRQVASVNGMVPLGESPAPMDLGVLDLLVEILVAADGIADEVSDAAEMPRLAGAASWMADPTPYLRRAAAFVGVCTTADQARIEAQCDELIHAALGMLGLIGDGQQLAVLCPWCGGRSVSAPIGGALTMRVRVRLPAGKKSTVSVDPADVEWFVVCEGLGCSPPSKDCGERLRGRPAWPLKTEADHLAKLLEKAAAVDDELDAIVAGLAS